MGEAADQPRHGRKVQTTEDECIHRAEEAQRKKRFRQMQTQHETEEETIERRTEEAHRLREFRQVQNQQETKEENIERRAEEAKRKKRFRQMQTQHQTEEETIEHRTEEAHRLREFRQVQKQQETEEENIERRAEEAKRKKRFRQMQTQHETEEETIERRAEEAHRLRKFRQVLTQQETEDDAIERRTEEAQRKRVYRQRSNTLLEVYHHNNFDESRVEIHDCGLMNVECQFCHSLNFVEEKSSDNTFNYCCHKGTVLLDDENEAHREFPPLLKDLLSNPNHPDSSNFKINIRSFNSTLSFASMGAQVDHVAGYGPYCFKIHGQVYHRTSHMHPVDGARQYAQMYVIDSSMANDLRLQHTSNQNLDVRILRNLDQLIRQVNVYAKAYKTLREVEIHEETLAVEEGRSIPTVSMAFSRDRNVDRKRYNLPTVDEIAMIFRSADGAPPFERDFRVYPRDPAHPLITMNILSPHLDPMTYVLFYPYGEPGWQPDIPINLQNRPHRRRIRVTMLQWKIAQIAVRINRFNPILNGGKLFQQWAVDSYAQVEAHNLSFVSHQQGRLRVEQYRGLMDHLNNIAFERGTNVGRAVILPSSFQGSPRNMREKYHDAMAIVAKYGKPDLFITMTCNPYWPEIQNNLFPGQQACDRPDLVVRVFSLKLKSFIKDITKNKVFGAVRAYVYTIEFQKRGLPHAHMLFILTNEDKIDTADKIDRYVCTEIPDPRQEPKLHEIVLKTMIHGPCGILNPRSPCMENNICTKHFPKPFQQQTIVEVNGYPLYRRRSGVEAHVGQFTVDNRFVVPYNKFLTMRYNCHINVEACQSVKAIKYIFKYIYKGYDCANIIFQEGHDNIIHDEIKQYLDARYVSAPEAMWRLLENSMHERSHAVIRLSIHLPDEQLVYFQEGDEETAVSRAHHRQTHLTAWFKLNRLDENARQYLYTEIPHHYVYDQKTTDWKLRKRAGDNVIPRMYSVSPRDEERFYLRMLLQHVRGPQSFEDIRTVQGIVHETFKAAAITRHLLDDDTEWIHLMQEASTFNMPRQLRQTFALICIFNSPNNPFGLFEQFKEFLAEDYQRNFSTTIAENKALRYIDSIMRMHGRNCMEFGMPEPGPIDFIDTTYDPHEECKLAKQLIPTLNPLQRSIFDEICSVIDENTVESRFFFVDGPGGTGKTYLYNTIMSHLRGQSRSVLAFATTGIAADLLKGGRTVHSGFKIPLSAVETSISSMKIPSFDSNKLRDACLIIIDEASMLSSHSLRIIDQLLKEIMNDARPFGGKTFMLGGDFRQTSNIVPHGTQTDILEVCIKSSPLWQHVKKRSLISNMRTAGQNTFNDWVLQVGNGDLSNDLSNLSRDLIELPAHLVENTDLVASVFGEKISTTTADEILEVSKKVILTPKNTNATDLNYQVLGLLESDIREYRSVDSIVTEDINDTIDFPVEFLNELCPSGLPPHILKLKVGAFIMLLRNLDPKNGLLNGTRLVVRGLQQNFIDAEIITGSKKGERVFIPRLSLEPSESSLPFKMRRRQFPVILAFVLTINKAQGQSFEKVGVYLPEPVFGHGQLYVALTRCRHHEHIKVHIRDNPEQGRMLSNDTQRYFTKNVVIKQLLL